LAASAHRISTGRLAAHLLLHRGLFMFGAVVIIILVLVAIFAPVIAPYNPILTDMQHSLAPPSATHWLGTDNLGRDTFSRLIYGTRTSLTVGLSAVAAALVLGGLLGTAAGFLGGVVNTVIMRAVDTLMAIPMLLLALTLAAVLGGGLKNVVIAISISMIPPFARLMFAQTLTIKERDYVASLRSMGATRWRTVFGHVMPNAYPAVLVFGTMMIGNAILGEAGLSYLGIGITPPGAAWGAMVSTGFQYLTTNPWMSVAPGVAIMLVVFAFNMVGDGLRDVLDPRLRGTM
jgi:ABC-type dipeptide/oligopeptide/nickel transport system permease subunit